MQIIAKTLGGSHSYGLDTESSDKDYRGIFVNTDIGSILGLDRCDHQVNQGNGVDEVYYELRNALRLLRSANTQIIELLYSTDFLDFDDRGAKVVCQRQNLVDSSKLFASLRGYIQS